MGQMDQERVERQRRRAIATAARRVHPLVVAAQGHASAPTRKEVQTLIRDALEAAYCGDYDDLEYFHCGPLVVHVEKQQRTWDHFQVFVTGTPVMFRYHDADKMFPEN